MAFKKKKFLSRQKPEPSCNLATKTTNKSKLVYNPLESIVKVCFIIAMKYESEKSKCPEIGQHTVQKNCFVKFRIPLRHKKSQQITNSAIRSTFKKNNIGQTAWVRLLFINLLCQLYWAIAFNICTSPSPLLWNSGIRQGKGKKFVEFFWGKVRNTGIQTVQPSRFRQDYPDFVLKSRIPTNMQSG